MSDNSSSGGIGVFTVLFIVFLVLKLTEVIDWPWICVFAPLFIPYVVIFLLLGIIGWMK